MSNTTYALILAALVAYALARFKHKCEASREMAAHRAAERRLEQDYHRRVYEASQRAFTQGTACGARGAEVERAMGRRMRVETVGRWN